MGIIENQFIGNRLGCIKVLEVSWEISYFPERPLIVSEHIVAINKAFDDKKPSSSPAKEMISHCAGRFKFYP